MAKPYWQSVQRETCSVELKENPFTRLQKHCGMLISPHKVNLVGMGIVLKGLMVNVYYYPEYRNQTVHCSKCEWTGSGLDCKKEEYDPLSSAVDITCPDCGKFMGLIQYPHDHVNTHVAVKREVLRKDAK